MESEDCLHCARHKLAGWLAGGAVKAMCNLMTLNSSDSRTRPALLAACCQIAGARGLEARTALAHLQLFGLRMSQTASRTYIIM